MAFPHFLQRLNRSNSSESPSSACRKNVFGHRSRQQQQEQKLKKTGASLRPIILSFTGRVEQRNVACDQLKKQEITKTSTTDAFWRSSPSHPTKKRQQFGRLRRNGRRRRRSSVAGTLESSSSLSFSCHSPSTTFSLQTKPKKKVSFSDSVQVREVDSCSLLSDAQKRKLWFQAQEYHRIRQRIRKVLEYSEANPEPPQRGQRKICLRGLESMRAATMMPSPSPLPSPSVSSRTTSISKTATATTSDAADKQATTTTTTPEESQQQEQEELSSQGKSAHPPTTDAWKSAWICVSTEQERQRKIGTVDPEAMALAYQAVTFHVKEQAQARGLMDAKEIQVYLKKDQHEFFNNNNPALSK